MSGRVSVINTVIESIPDVKLIKSFEQNGSLVQGCVSFFVEGLELPLEFDVKILPQYPLKSHDTETIKFFNRDLSEYRHIMRDGSICIHTAHSPLLSHKLVYDFESVKAWIKKYYIDKESDTHYEHLIVQPKTFRESHFVYFFNNEIEYTFHKNQYGYVDYSFIGDGNYCVEKINSNILQKFYDTDRKELIDVKWNYRLKSLEKSIGLFIFLKDAPSKNQRWAFDNWNDFEALLPQDFLKFLHTIEKTVSQNKGKHLPLFVGYNISDTEIHWQVIMLEIGNFPIYGEKENKQWLTMLDDRDIDWAMTKNCSQKYFFGRGRLNDKIITGKILIIGIGAIGSIVAKTLVRCGCTKIGFIDYDVKEPENVCRSEYSFASGINNKTSDLENELYFVSPFFEPVKGGYQLSELFDFFIKSHLTDKTVKSKMEKYLNEYDIIIDCTADNDLLYVLSYLKINSTFLNISISNHAKQLVCAAEQNRYDFVTTQYNGNVLKFDIDGLHNPTGCWNPTFKASYNDINVLVQFAIKHINLRCEQKRALRNFVIETDDTDCFTINLKEF
jgi:hypothetical protein